MTQPGVLTKAELLEALRSSQRARPAGLGCPPTEQLERGRERGELRAVARGGGGAAGGAAGPGGSPAGVGGQALGRGLATGVLGVLNVVSVTRVLGPGG